jgi:transcriptional regulator with XRE-family HTH domain
LERKKFQRIIRDRHLTDAEVASDELIRSQVLKEFPPAESATPEAGGISDSLRRAIQSSPKSVYQICKETGISQIVVSRFLSGERDIRLATADRLAKALGIEVTSHR